MAVRSFGGTGGSAARVLLSAGTVPGTLGGAWTLLFLLRRVSADGAYQTKLAFTGAAGSMIEFYLTSGNQLSYENGGGEQGTSIGVASANQWCLVAITKASGSAAARGHVGRLDTGAWSHGSYSGTLGNIATAITGVSLGYSPRYGYSSEGGTVRYAAAAIVEGTALSDAQVEALTTRYGAWLDLSPTASWRLNQASTATAVVDDTGGGADQSSTTGTTVVTDDDPPGWDPEVTRTGIHRVDVRGAANPTVSGSTSTAVDMPAAGSITVGNYLLARVALDNAGTNGAAPTLGVTDPRSNTWTVLGPALQDPGAANAGVACYIAYARVASGYTDGDDLTFTTDASPPARAVVVEEWTGIDAASPVAVAATTAAGASTSPSVSRTPTASGQLVYCALAVEGPPADAITQDTDTTDGSWQVLAERGTGSGTAASNVTIYGAAKQVGGTSAQTWGPTITSRDWAALAVVFAEQSTAVDLVVADASHGHTADLPTVAQVHSLTAAHAAHGQAADSPALSQAHVLAAADAQHSHAADAAALSQVHELAAADSSHAHSADHTTITQAHALAAADAGHGHSADAAAVTQTHLLAAGDAEHGHTADAAGLVQVVPVTPADASHGQTADAPALTQAHALAAASAEHGHTAGQADLTVAYTLAAADSTHGHAADAPALTQAHGLAAQDAAHGHTADPAALTQAHVPAAADAAHSHLADPAAVATGYLLTAADATHAHTATTAGLTQAHLLAAASAEHGHTVDAAAITQLHLLAALSATHMHTADVVTLSGAVIPGEGPATVGSTTASHTLHPAAEADARSTTGSTLTRSTTTGVSVR